MSTLVVNPGSAIDDKCRVMYENLLENGTVTASSENPSYPVANCFDWVTCDWFRPASFGPVYITLALDAADGANYFAFYGQDIYKYGGSIRLQYDDGSGWTDACDAISPNDNAPRVVFFDRKVADSWRVAITCDSIFNLGVVAFGEYVALPYGMYIGWTPPTFARANTYINNVSEGGNFLGRSVIAKGIKTTLVLQGAQDAWMRSIWLPFIKHIEEKPFFFAPNVSAYPNEVALVWAKSDIPAPTHQYYGYMGATYNLRGVIE
jgi:hypothetical protein